MNEFSIRNLIKAISHLKDRTNCSWIGLEGADGVIWYGLEGNWKWEVDYYFEAKSQEEKE